MRFGLSSYTDRIAVYREGIVGRWNRSGGGDMHIFEVSVRHPIVEGKRKNSIYSNCGLEYIKTEGDFSLQLYQPAKSLKKPRTLNDSRPLLN